MLKIKVYAVLPASRLRCVGENNGACDHLRERSNLMLRDIFMKYYQEQGYNCAETIVRAANEYYDLGLHDRDMIMVAGFGGGMQTGNTCGAIIAGVSVLSLKYVEKKAHDSADIRPVVLNLIRKFKKEYDSLLCRDIKAISFKPDIRCRETVAKACDIIEETIAEYDKKLATEGPAVMPVLKTSR